MLMLIRFSCACIVWAVITSSLYVNTTICMRLAAQLIGLSCPHQDEAHEDDRHVVLLLPPRLVDRQGRGWGSHCDHPGTRRGRGHGGHQRGLRVRVFQSPELDLVPALHDHVLAVDLEHHLESRWELQPMRL